MTIEQWQQHVRDMVKQAEEALKQKYVDQCLPKLKDAELYLDRAAPNVDQALRCIHEVEALIGMWLD